MEKYTEIKMSGKMFKLSFNIRRLAKLEREAGKTVMELLQAISVTGTISIDTTIVAFANSQTEPLQLNEAADVLQEYCDNGGSLNELNIALIEAIYESGIVIRGPEKNAQQEITEGV